MSSCSSLSVIAFPFSLLHPMPAATVFRLTFETIVDAEGGLAITKQEVTIVLELPAHALEDLALGSNVEIDQDVAQKNDVHARKGRPRSGKIHFDELHHRTKILLDFPVQLVAGEVAAQILDRQAAVYLELPVTSALRA